MALQLVTEAELVSPSAQALIDSIQRAAEILDANDVPPRYVFVDPAAQPTPPVLRWKAGIWSVS